MEPRLSTEFFAVFHCEGCGDKEARSELPWQLLIEDDLVHMA